jgi:hypothetical protein
MVRWCDSHRLSSLLPITLLFPKLLLIEKRQRGVSKSFKLLSPMTWLFFWLPSVDSGTRCRYSFLLQFFFFKSYVLFLYISLLFLVGLGFELRVSHLESRVNHTFSPFLLYFGDGVFF